MVVVKSEHDLLGHGTLKCAGSKSLQADADLGKLTVTLIIIGCSWSKMGVVS